MPKQFFFFNKWLLSQEPVRFKVLQMYINKHPTVGTKCRDFFCLKYGLLGKNIVIFMKLLINVWSSYFAFILCCTGNKQFPKICYLYKGSLICSVPRLKRNRNNFSYSLLNQEHGIILGLETESRVGNSLF